MIRYRLDDLGWFQFEWLCQSLLKATLGLSVEAWDGHSDLGRDLYHSGALKLETSGSAIAGPIVFQAKFVEEANAAGAKPFEKLNQAARAEIARIRDRISQRSWEKPGAYILLTNAPLTDARQFVRHGGHGFGARPGGPSISGINRQSNSAPGAGCARPVAARWPRGSSRRAFWCGRFSRR